MEDFSTKDEGRAKDQGLRNKDQVRTKDQGRTKHQVPIAPMNPRAPSPGDMLSLAIEKPAAGGRMIARLDGRVVLGGGAIPGERVTARIERAGKGVLFADTVTPDEPSSDRRPV